MKDKSKNLDNLWFTDGEIMKSILILLASFLFILSWLFLSQGTSEEVNSCEYTSLRCYVQEEMGAGFECTVGFQITPISEFKGEGEGKAPEEQSEMRGEYNYPTNQTFEEKYCTWKEEESITIEIKENLSGYQEANAWFEQFKTNYDNYLTNSSKLSLKCQEE